MSTAKKLRSVMLIKNVASPQDTYEDALFRRSILLAYTKPFDVGRTLSSKVTEHSVGETTTAS